MALYDHRTFAWKNDWWVAEVHASSGAGWTDRPALTDERLFFTCLSDKDAPSRTARIPAGLLNRIAHAALGKVLETAESFESRFDLSPSNAPDADELRRHKQLVDAEGLTWAFRPAESILAGHTGPTKVPAIELICLDDSAMRSVIPFKNLSTLSEYEAARGEVGLHELVNFVKSNYQDFAPEHHDW
jgi:hypothetical protein